MQNSVGRHLQMGENPSWIYLWKISQFSLKVVRDLTLWRLLLLGTDLYNLTALFISYKTCFFFLLTFFFFFWGCPFGELAFYWPRTLWGFQSGLTQIKIVKRVRTPRPEAGPPAQSLSCGRPCLWLSVLSTGDSWSSVASHPCHPHILLPYWNPGFPYFMSLGVFSASEESANSSEKPDNTYVKEQKIDTNSSSSAPTPMSQGTPAWNQPELSNSQKWSH